MSAKRSSGFTLIEIMIVVVILAVLAATIIPQFSTSVNDSKVSALQTNLQSLRTQIQLYGLQHNGAFPALTSASIPQLLTNTDITGATGTVPATPTAPICKARFRSIRSTATAPSSPRLSFRPPRPRAPAAGFTTRPRAKSLPTTPHT